MRASFIAAAAARSSRFADKPALPLDYVRRSSLDRGQTAKLIELPARQFVNRTKALALYRQFIRATKSLGDARTRWETMEWIRNDFERNRAVVDSVMTRAAFFRLIS